MHTRALSHRHTQTFIHADKWLIVFWIPRGIFQFNILSLLGIDTLFLPHSTDGRTESTCVCVCVCAAVYTCVSTAMSEAVHSSIHLVMIPLENKGHYSFINA